MISVVIGAHNAERYIARAVESMLAQTYSDFELIAVDDGSTDRTAAILRSCAARDARVRVIEAAHQGISGAANRGIAEARQAWIARMDADDIALPHRLERQLAAAAAAPEVVLWGSWALYVNDAETVFGVSRNGPTTIAEFTAQRARGEDGYVSHTTWFVRRDVLLAAGGYDSSFDSTEDLELLDRIAELGPTLTIPEALVLYRVHSGSVSTKSFARQHELARYVRERRRARLVGRSLTRDEYVRRKPGRSVIERTSTGLQMFSAYCYRTAALRLAGGRPLAASLWLAGAAAAHPFYAVRRLWTQVLSGSARRIRNAAPPSGRAAPAHCQQAER